MSTPSLYERLGGSEAIDAAVDAFHDRVARDARVNHYFRDRDMDRLLRHQKAFFVDGTGGPIEYPGQAIAAVHTEMSIDDEAFDIFAGHLGDTLLAFEVPAPERGELLDIIESYRDAVVTER